MRPLSMESRRPGDLARDTTAQIYKGGWNSIWTEVIGPNSQGGFFQICGLNSVYGLK